MKPKYSGLSLIELMVVISIVAILATIAYPSYKSHIDKTRRIETQNALMALANALERYYIQNNTYIGATVGATGIFPNEAPINDEQKVYNLTISSISANAYTVQATPKGPQTGDGLLQLDSVGNKIWNSKDDGSGDNKNW